MKDIIAGNIARYRKEIGITQEGLANKLGITYQAVSKWETKQSLPDISLLPTLAGILHVSIDALLGYASYQDIKSNYEDVYSKEEYYWGVIPSNMCLKVLEIIPPIKPLRLLDIGCGEGKDAVFFARCGYHVSAFDISDAGLGKLKQLADKANVHVKVIKANICDYRLDSKYDILYSSGALRYIKPELRDEIMENYRINTNAGGINAFQAFLNKPFIDSPPEQEAHSYNWLSGQLFTYYHDWYIESCSEDIFNYSSSETQYQRVANRLYARKKY